mmetsp:Transcript_9035/g.26253  ORF Transcript_9035/g.26253 Transcript_9035/m.26253 type:complete len:229 (-) Transcript_9035:57-743(-)
MSHPLRKPCSWSLYGAPPYTHTVFKLKACPTQSKSAPTCFANSLVGHKTHTTGLRPCNLLPVFGVGSVLLICSTIGKTNANVFPHPVLALPTISFPLIAVSKVCACMANNASMPFFCRAHTTSGERLKFSNAKGFGVRASIRFGTSSELYPPSSSEFCPSIMVNAFIFVGLFTLSSSSSFSRSFRFSFLPEEEPLSFLSFLDDLSFFELLPILLHQEEYVLTRRSNYW